MIQVAPIENLGLLGAEFAKKRIAVEAPEL
jgi:hypothetical protein